MFVLRSIKRKRLGARQMELVPKSQLLKPFSKHPLCRSYPPASRRLQSRSTPDYSSKRPYTNEDEEQAVSSSTLTTLQRRSTKQAPVISSTINIQIWRPPSSIQSHIQVLLLTSNLTNSHNTHQLRKCCRPIFISQPLFHSFNRVRHSGF